MTKSNTDQINENNRMNVIYQRLLEYKKKDFDFLNGHILGSMITQVHPLAKKAYMQFIETNIGDPGLCPGTKQMENAFIEFLKTLVHAPKSVSGHIVSGGTEGNITAMWIAKVLSNKREIIIPKSAHFSFQKIASLMDMKLITLPLTKSYTIDARLVRNHVTKDTAAIVGIAGSTDLGAIDPIPELGEICIDEQIFLHVDAAFGGFVIPFLKDLGHSLPDFDFSVKGVSSISLDAHKMGQAPIPLGTVLFKEKQWIDSISVTSPCISIDKQAGFLGTRSGGSIAAGYAVSEYFGFEGYKKLVESCMKATQYMQKRIEEMGLSLFMPPTMNILAVQLLYPIKVTKALERYGWKVNCMHHLSSIRLVCMPHVTPAVIDEFIPLFKKICKKVGEL